MDPLIPPSSLTSSAAASPGLPGLIAQRTRIKLCGLSRVEDVQHAVALGADAIGMVFYPPSPRAISIARAVELARHVPPFVTIVGLFVNPDEALLREVTGAVPLGALQFHGDETPDQCATLAAAVRLPWLRAIRVKSDSTPANLVESAINYAAAQGLLLDAHVDGYGGGGKVFDWSIIPAELARRAVLSGGLNAQNVREAIARVRPYAVDVSSGIETEGARGVKDHARMAAFVSAVRAADASSLESPLSKP
jgi:phosphoribosylanthranilate isomerase